ncbi:amidohydrolase [Salmonella enterica subsp. enterica]|nr:amidohydrolase [Salmonella enterica subsp. enterica]ECI7436338.1 amidohydrolase [Salmonella enterica subsp. enterica]
MLMISLVPPLLSRTALLFLLMATGAATAARPAADIILHNGNIITLNDAQPQASALAISGSRIVAIGDDTATNEWRGDHTRTIDLQGKTVIPGLTDTHIHAIRGGQTWTFETYWYDSPSLKDALDKLRADANRRPHDQWVAVVGSWIPAQFAENRAPTVAELSHALPDHPAYIQYLYDYALVNQRGIDVLGLNDPPPPDLAGIRVERDAKGSATGKLFADIAAFNQLFASISSNADREGGLRQFFADMNARGVTGIIDPSAGPAAAYEPLFAMRNQGDLPLRVGYRIPVQPEAKGHEAQWFSNLMAFRPARADDGQLAFLGLGESLVAGMNDGVRMAPGFSSSEQDKTALRQVATFAAKRGIPLEIHAYTDDSADAILTIFEQVAQQYDLRPLRWSIAHLNTGSPQTLERMRKLGLAYTVQMGPYFEGLAIRDANPPGATDNSPPVRLALDKGLVVAGGTDSTRIGIAGVWHAIEYHITGIASGGSVRKPASERLTRLEALALYTRHAAWLAFAEQHRGQLSVGKQADLAVLNQPFMTMPEDRIDTIRAVLTLVDGRIVHESPDLNAGQ